MGDAKRKLNRRQEFLRLHSRCVYCAGRATTSDHCPPRSFFSGRHWPETYEFSACQPCNAAARLDEQAFAVLVRSAVQPRDEADQSEWKRLVDGVRNNQPKSAPCVCASRRLERGNVPPRLDRGVASQAQASCRALADRDRVSRSRPELEAFRQMVATPRSARPSAPGCPGRSRSFAGFPPLHLPSEGVLARIS